MSNVVNLFKPKRGFKVGDIVTLKSGGDACIVVETNEGTTVYGWFDENKKTVLDTSPNECLQLLYEAPTCDDDGFWSNLLIEEP